MEFPYWLPSQHAAAAVILSNALLECPVVWPPSLEDLCVAGDEGKREAIHTIAEILRKALERSRPGHAVYDKFARARCGRVSPSAEIWAELER